MATIVKNWVVGTTPEILENIHQNDVNIAIYNRNIRALKKEIDHLIKQNIEFSSNGDINTILNEITTVIELDKYFTMIQDIRNLLLAFKKVTNATHFQLLLTTIKTNMCRKFHIDMNDLRMLCTYSGPGTLWLTEDNINRKTLGSNGSNQSIVMDERNIQQTKTGSVIILKGAKYPNETTKALVHRSPTIEESGDKRLLLRIDTN